MLYWEVEQIVKSLMECENIEQEFINYIENLFKEHEEDVETAKQEIQFDRKCLEDEIDELVEDLDEQIEILNKKLEQAHHEIETLKEELKWGKE